MPAFSLGQRVKAARQLAGFTNVEDLSEAIGQDGLRDTRLRQIERDEKPGQVRDYGAIAEACGLPTAWFTADFSRLAEISEDPRRLIAEQSAAAVARARERRAAAPADIRSRRAGGRAS